MLSFKVQKRFGDFSLDVCLDVGNEIVVLLAPSGAGKSLVLNLVSGIVKPDAGTVMLDDSVLFDSSKKISLPIRKRNIGYIFQDYALFPNKSVQENITFGMNKNNRSESAISTLLKRFNLEDKRHAYPHQLSGGQKQRVSIARALAAQSMVMLFDEPLSAVDVQLRESLLNEIGEVSKTYSLPVLYVTHNFREAEQIADRIAVMDNGKLIEVAESNTIFRKPAQLFTARFLGVKNIFPCKIESKSPESWKLKIFDSVRMEMPAKRDSGLNDNAWLCVHPKDVRLLVTEEDRPNMLYAYVEEMKIIDRVYRVVLQVLNADDREKKIQDFKLYMDIEELTCRKYKLNLDDIVRISLKPDRIFLCSPDNQP